jgi:hypothetical protein
MNLNNSACKRSELFLEPSIFSEFKGTFFYSDIIHPCFLNKGREIRLHFADKEL